MKKDEAAVEVAALHFSIECVTHKEYQGILAQGTGPFFRIYRGRGKHFRVRFSIEAGQRQCRQMSSLATCMSHKAARLVRESDHLFAPCS